MTDRAGQAMVTVTVTPQEFGAILGCVSSAADRSSSAEQRVLFTELADTLREAQRSMLDPLPIAEGMGLVREIQDRERATVALLRET